MASGITASVKINKAKLQAIIRESPQQAINLVDALAFEGEGYLKRSFGTSPSAPGEPPGVDTGAYRASVHVENLGQFKRGIATGTDYGPHLEFGTTKMAARPHMIPMSIYLQGQVVPFWMRFIK